MRTMATNNKSRRQTNRNGVRPKYIDLGTDTEGGEHCYRTTDDTVFVVRDGRIVHRETLGTSTVDDWMDHADDLTGWADKRYGRTLAEMLASTGWV